MIRDKDRQLSEVKVTIWANDATFSPKKLNEKVLFIDTNEGIKNKCVAALEAYRMLQDIRIDSLVICFDGATYRRWEIYNLTRIELEKLSIKIIPHPEPFCFFAYIKSEFVEEQIKTGEYDKWYPFPMQ